MGCAKSKPRAVYVESGSPNEKASNHSASTRSSARRPGSSAKVETADPVLVIEKEKEKEKDRAKGRTKQSGAQVVEVKADDSVGSRRRGERAHAEAHPRSGAVAKSLEGEQVAAGWPGWLSQVAGEAIKGWIPRHAASFEKLDKIGQGTYSNVYKARDLETGKIVALKKVRFDNLEPESVRFMAREIQVLRRLDHPNVVKLEGLVTSRMSCSLYLVFEYMEHDLAGLAACPGIMFTEAQVKCYMQQLLRGLEHCHRQGVLHRDIKGSNLLLDNSGVLKIADFGLATFFNPDQKQPLTSRVVTLWYRPPELLLGATEYGVAVDLWSTGCILAELLAGKPIMPGRTEVEQLHKIFKLCGSPSEEYWKKSKLPHATIFKPQQPYKRCIQETFKEFPASSLALLDTLLAIEPADRGNASQALGSEFFTTKPLACEPSSLPQYPPSKEFDAKIRDDEARR
uniref:Protein kinase domain-containing protein n=2 Tax=Physcomitrium patens TaxID=3218 RepID=A0A7I4F5E5_PHYPA